MTAESNKKLRQLRVEIGKRATDFDPRGKRTVHKAADSNRARTKGDEINSLFRKGHIEEAQGILNKEITKYPNELRFQNLKTLLLLTAGPIGDFEPAMRQAAATMEMAEAQNNAYYAQASLTNLGIVARDKGEPELSLCLLLAAHFLDRVAGHAVQVQPLQNLAGHYARHDMPEKAMVWLRRALDTAEVEYGRPWYEVEELREWCLKDSDLATLRGGDVPSAGHRPFLELLELISNENCKI